MLAAATDGVGTKLEIARDGRSSRHGGHRPGGDVRRRRRVHRRRTALLPGLPGGGPGRARTGRLAGGRRRRGMPTCGLRPAGRRDGRTSRRDARRPVRHGGVLRRGRRRSRPARAGPGAGRRRADRARVHGTARQWLLAGALGAAGSLRPRGDARGARRVRSPTNCWSRARSTRPWSCRWLATACSTPRLTSPAAGSSRTSPARCLRASGREIHRGAWPEPAIFSLVQAASGASDDEMFATFNMGVGHGAGRRSRQRRRGLGAQRRSCLHDRSRGDRLRRVDRLRVHRDPGRHDQAD